MVKVNVDWVADDTIQEVLRLIRKYGGRILDFEPDGPGGGNPNLALSFDTEARALGFLREYSPYESAGSLREFICA